MRMTNFIITFTGRRLDPLDPQPDQVDARDVAVGLASVSRDAGQLSYFYCVAEHSVLVARLATHGECGRRDAFYTARGWPTDIKGLRLTRLALLHDAEEAYLGDLIRPVKHHPSMAVYRGIAQRLRDVVVATLAPYDTFTEAEHAAVHAADLRAYVIERDPTFRPACATPLEARVAWLDAWAAVQPSMSKPCRAARP